MTGASAVGGRLLLSYLHHASTSCACTTPRASGCTTSRCLASAPPAALAAEWQDRETFFSYTSITTPTEIHRFDLSTGKTTLFKRPKTAFNPDEFETRREFITSKDGTCVPVFIAARKGLARDGRQPTLLYGYGGFNVSQTPVYSVTAATWLRMGGVSRARGPARWWRVRRRVARSRHAAAQAERVRRLHRRGRMADRQQVHLARAPVHLRWQQWRLARRCRHQPAA